ncbi:MAG TPA: hypothetical protein VMI92_02375 [Steroidobacteraceae bacterium]|nr:hypothetical protein [Steroidobacteraceae bacterium]
MNRPASIASLWPFVAAPLIFAATALLLGKATGWDLENYHWYNPYALLHGRLGFDVAVGHVATYYNPLADLPLYWFGTHAPAWVTGAVLGALFGLAVALVGAIAWEMMDQVEPRWRLSLAMLLAAAGAIGGGAFPALGDVANDVPVAIGIFAALWILLRHYPALRSARPTPTLWRVLLLAGCCAGISVGLKLTMAVFALGLLVAVLLPPPDWRARSRAVLALGAGMGAGFLACAGPWLWRMWRFSGNPLFPYFNHWFHSRLAADSAYRDVTYLNHDLRTQLLFPWLFTHDSHRAAEWAFRDAHVLAAYVLVPLGVLLMAVRHRHGVFSQASRRTLFLFCFAAVGYLAWLHMFSIYRYLLPLEMLAPLLIVLALLQWPLPRAARVVLIAAVLVALQSVTRMSLERSDWAGRYVSVRVPPLTDPQHSMVLMAGTAPMSYVIPSFPAAIPFLRVDGWMVPQEDRSSGLALQMRQRVADHTGPLYMLFVEYERARATGAAASYGLTLRADQCRTVSSNIGEDLQLCPLQRLAA